MICRLGARAAGPDLSGSRPPTRSPEIGAIIRSFRPFFATAPPIVILSEAKNLALGVCLTCRDAGQRT
jgi:hypothetical protein